MPPSTSGPSHRAPRSPPSRAVSWVTSSVGGWGPRCSRRRTRGSSRSITSSRRTRFFSKHGRKTIVIGHFVGVVRTFTPVIAGASGMRYPVFLAYDIVGATLWGAGLTLVGYHLGGVSFVNEHLEWMVLAIAVLSTPRSSGRCWARRPSVDGPSPRTA